MEPLGICRTAFYVSKKIMCAVLIVFSLRGRAQSSVMMEKETCAFLQSLPAGLQKTQADAVRRAINGDCTALISVRNSRNTNRACRATSAKAGASPETSRFPSESLPPESGMNRRTGTTPPTRRPR